MSLEPGDLPSASGRLLEEESQNEQKFFEPLSPNTLALFEDSQVQVNEDGLDEIKEESEGSEGAQAEAIALV